MAVITKITTQKNNSERFNIYIDQGDGETYGFSVDQDILIAWRLTKGMEIDIEEIEKLLADDQIKKAYNLALSYLSFRMRSEKEVVDYLKGKLFTEVEINQVIKKLKDYNFLNDQEFALAFVRTKKNTGFKGPKVIKNELITKGIKGKIAEEALAEYSHSNQIELVCNWINKQTKRNVKESEKAFRQKVMRQLLAKGFSQEVIEEGLRQIPIIVEEDQQWEAIAFQAKKAERKYSHLSDYEYRYKMKQWLYTKGFSMDLIERYLNDDDL